MTGKKPTGRAPVRRTVGRARVGQAIGRAPSAQRARTQLLRLGDETPEAVFVDSSGARRRRLRRLSYALGALLLLLLLGFWLSQLGGFLWAAP